MDSDIGSMRPADAIAAFRRQLQQYQTVPEARDFLELSRQQAGAAWRLARSTRVSGRDKAATRRPFRFSRPC